MTLPALPAQGSTSWYPWAQGIHTAVETGSAGQPAPIYLDAISNFYPADAMFVTGQGSTSTTATAAASIGATTLAVASGTGLIDGVWLSLNPGTAGQQIVKITAGGGTTTLTVSPALTAPVANGAAIAPFWNDASHPTLAGYTALAYWIAYAKQADGTDVFKDPGSTRPVVFLGDSWFVPQLTPYATGINARYPSAIVQMKGVSGDNSTALLARFATDVPANASYVVINEPGVNDIYGQVTNATISGNLEKLVKRIQALGAVPVVLGPPPLQVNPALSKIANVLMSTALAAPASFPATSAAALDLRYAQATPSGSVGYGTSALRKDTNGSNTALGQGALANNTTGGSNVAVGQFSLTTSATASFNTAVGQATLNLATGNDNTAIGYQAGAAISTGINNTAIGSGALKTASTATHNVAIGRNSLQVNTANANVAIGRDSGAKVTTGNSNVFVGSNAGGDPNFVGANGTTTGTSQTVVGAFAGQGTATQVNDIVALGYIALASATGAVALGKGAIAGHSNSVALGTSTTTTAANQVMVGGKDVEVTDTTKGLILKSPDGTRYRVTVANGGALTVAVAA